MEVNRTNAKRKGFVFTTVAAVIVIVLIIFATSETRTLTRTQTQTARAHTMDAYLDNLERDLPRAAYIAGFRTLIAMEEHVSATGEFLLDAETTFLEAFANGTINSTPYGILDDSTFTAFAQRFAQLAERQGMLSNITVLSTTLSQSDPWSLRVTANLSFTVADRVGTASFERRRLIVVDVPIIDIKDPLYSIGTQGRAPHPIRRRNATGPFITPGNDTSALIEFINASEYRASTRAPGIIGRFEGRLDADAFGIESLVDVRELRLQDIPVDTCVSIVDYKYFNGTATTPNRLIVNTDVDDIWLTDDDLPEYDASGKTVGDKPCT